MAIIDLRIDLVRVARALERIADGIERLSPPRILNPNPRPAEFITVDPAAIAEAEDEAERRREAGTEEA